MNTQLNGPDVWYDVEPGGQAKVCERGYYDERFLRGASRGVSVCVDDVVHHLVPAYTLSTGGREVTLEPVVDVDGTLRVLAGDDVVFRAPVFEWFEVRERQLHP